MRQQIAVITLAVALGLAWTGVAIPADVKEETKQKATAVKDKLQSAGETVKDKTAEAMDKVKEKLHRGKERAVAHEVKAAQEALHDKGFDPGPLDGVMGPRTRAAVIEFQKKEDLKVTGRLDLATMSRLGVDQGSERSPASASPATVSP